MLKFYWENLKYYIKLGWYRYGSYFILGLLLLFVLFLGPFIGAYLFKIPLPDPVSKILLASLLLSPVIVAFFIGLILGWKALYITFYSLGVEWKESGVTLEVWYKIHKFFTSPKKLLALFLLPLLTGAGGYFIYKNVMVNTVDPIRIVLTLIIYALLVLLVLTRRFLLHLLHTLWHLFTGILWKLIVILVVVLSQVLLLVGIYSVVSLIIAMQ